MLNLKKLGHSFKYALSGFRQVIRREQNFRVELLCFFLACALGFYFRISLSEWTVVIAASFLVLFAELLNTAIERVTDLVTDKRRAALARQAKDIGAAAVLLMAIQALIVGLFIFLPKILSIIKAL